MLFFMLLYVMEFRTAVPVHPTLPLLFMYIVMEICWCVCVCCWKLHGNLPERHALKVTAEQHVKKKWSNCKNTFALKCSTKPKSDSDRKTVTLVPCWHQG